MPAPLLVSNLTNLRYLTGLEMTAGLLLLNGGEKLLFVDDRYTEKAKNEAKTGIRVRPMDDLKKHLQRLRRVRFEADDVTVARRKRWRKQFRGTRFMSSEGVIEQMRRSKRTSELRFIEKACRITDHVMRAIPRKIRTAVTEKQLAWEIEKFARDLGADAMAFPSIVAFGAHTSRPHHSPTHQKLKRGDIVQIDMGVKVDGYCSDCSRVFFTKKPTEEQRNVFNLLKRIVKECTKRAKSGASNRALDKLARSMLRTVAFPSSTSASASSSTLDSLFLHSLGHGVGLEIHEGVNLSRKAKETKLKANEVITIEPGIYFEGKWGMRIEDTIVVTGRGGKRLTNVKY